MTDDWDEIGFIISSKYRIRVLKRLVEGPATPSKISEDEDISIASVSHALKQLRERDLVELLVDEDRRKGRVYGITERGERLWTEIQNRELVD
ncbi:helix-turn-helix domain-containing protein [Natronomonas sp. CBA1123]|jgi:DNA-binding transcriptional ArsR family regulator|uniref:ArsR/SmtB family transcription factor n=1 Tax=Natronomonas sp. CBA1123 TaxID=2668070 RepID=UPI0012EA7C45|nr:winged helix-turn-helix domain-containing protein [Natronomonas sp. CBA1123]MUV86265.1 helix-turn-helix domain-containing protein [Natronomonas sp. CBA1123]